MALRKVPNYFIRAKLCAVHQTLLESNPALSNALVNVATSHLTLMTFRARLALHQSVECIKKEFNELYVEFHGVGSFDGRVIYAEPMHGREDIVKIAEIVRNTFESVGIESTDKRDCNPHLTIAKLTRKVVGIRKIGANSYMSHKDDNFGIEQIKVIQICSMHSAKRPDGYYHVVEELALFGNDE